MRRREFISLIDAIAGWSLATAAQQQNRLRLVGAIAGIPDEPIMQARYAVFLQELQNLGWTDGRNVRGIYRYGAADPETTMEAMFARIGGTD